MNNATCETCQRKQGTTNVALDEFYLKNHLGSTVAVMDNGAVSTLKAAYDYRATVVAMRTKQQVAKCCPPFGEQVDLEQKGDKVTENFTGKCPQGECCENTLVYFHCRAAGHSTLRQERDDETELNYFGARYLDPMLGLWISVDAYREFWNSYAYGPGSPVNGYDGDGNVWKTVGKPYYTNVFWNWLFNFIDGMGQSSNTMGRKVYYSANSNPTDIRVRHITQQWVYDPNASDEVNGRHPFGTRRAIKQTKADERLAKMQYQNLYGNGSTLGWSDNMNWTPQIFDNSYKDFPSIELDYSNLYEPNGNASFGSPIIEYEPEPNGNVEIGELICATCSD